MVCFRYIIVNTLHKGGGDDDVGDDITAAAAETTTELCAVFIK
jgi:hypothetical protein